MTIKEYWNLIGQEPFLARTWQPEFSQACSFCRMLMNHKNFHFTQNWHDARQTRQNWWHDFLKKSKKHVIGPLLTIFGHFSLMKIFSRKSSSVTHNYIWAPNSMLSFRKKLMSQSRENLEIDGRTDGQTLFYRTLKRYKI